MAPRTPYIAVWASYLSTVTDSMSSGLSQLNVPFVLVSTGTPSTMYSGAWLRENECGPLMRTMTPPSGAAVTVAPETRPASNCSSDRTGGGSSLDVASGAAGARDAGAAAVDVTGAEAQAKVRPTRLMTATGRTREVDEVMGPPFAQQYSVPTRTWRGAC